VEELLGGLDLLYVEELVRKGRVDLGDWMLHSGAEACLVVLLPVQHPSRLEELVMCQSQGSMEM
jgi:hypothetical protein